MPAGLTNVVAIAAGGDSGIYSGSIGGYYSLALQRDGTVVAWGGGLAANQFGGLAGVISIAGGSDHVLAVRTGPATPVIALEPKNQYVVPGGNVTFTTRGAGLYGVTYQWQTNVVNLPGATNTSLTASNVQPATNNISYRCVISNELGTIASSNASAVAVTPPYFTSYSPQTNPVVNYGDLIVMTATATAPGQSSGFPVYYRWITNGVVNTTYGANYYSVFFDGFNGGTFTIQAFNAAGTNSITWTVAPPTNAINVTNDLLLIYNTNSADSVFVKNYYLAHRPMVSGANVLGISYTNSQSPGWYETITPTDLTNLILNPIGTWLTNNPAKRPQYVILFLDVPSRVFPITTYPTNGNYPADQNYPLPSVSHQLRSGVPNWDPLITCINMNGTNDCIAYINKLEQFGTNFSPGQLLISASAGGYGNTNYYFDNTSSDITILPNSSASGINASNGVVRSGGSPLAITYTNVTDTGLATHIRTGFNVAGYLSSGAHSSLGSQYALDGTVNWTGHSGWWIVETVESFNGLRIDPGQGTFIKWFSSNAFGGTNYSNTPVGAVTHVDEPFQPNVNDAAVFFRHWQAGKIFAICAWASKLTPEFQAVGDPFVTR